MEFGRRERTLLAEQLIVIFVVFALTNMGLHLARGGHPLGPGIFMFYTNWSNIVAAAVQACSLVCLLKGIELPRLLRILKLASTVMLTVTFLVVVAVLCPRGGLGILLDPKYMLFLHLLVPVLAVIDYLFLIDMEAPSKQDALFQIVPSLIYILGVVIVMVAMGNDSLAPYPFLRIYTQPAYVSALWIVALGVLISLISFGYSRLFLRTNPSAAAAQEPRGVQ